MRTLIALLIALAGCTTWDLARELPNAGGSSNSGSVATGLPCDVDALLGTYCRGCHGPLPVGGAPMPLVSYDDLMAPAKSDPTKRVADLCLTRMQDTSTPMPPSPPSPSATDVQAFATWLASGAAMGDCVAASNPLGAAPTCTSMTSWNGGNDGSSRMHPGEACISCHSSGEGPRFALAGTVFPTGHEPDDCNAANVGGAQVIITDANNNQTTLTPNSVGNFYAQHVTIALPYHAEVVYSGRTRAMSAAQSSGDCNSCHTQNGANGAPGRITLP